MYGENAYDQPQWALSHLLRGSLYVFMTLLALVNTTPLFRLCAQVILYAFCWATLDGMCARGFPPEAKLTMTSRDGWYERLCRHDTGGAIILRFDGLEITRLV
jgi:hypothetical protein